MEKASLNECKHELYSKKIRMVRNISRTLDVQQLHIKRTR